MSVFSDCHQFVCLSIFVIIPRSPSRDPCLPDGPHVQIPSQFSEGGPEVGVDRRGDLLNISAVNKVKQSSGQASSIIDLSDQYE